MPPSKNIDLDLLDKPMKAIQPKIHEAQQLIAELRVVPHLDREHRLARLAALFAAAQANCMTAIAILGEERRGENGA